MDGVGGRSKKDEAGVNMVCQAPQNNPCRSHYLLYCTVVLVWYCRAPSQAKQHYLPHKTHHLFVVRTPIRQDKKRKGKKFYSALMTSATHYLNKIYEKLHRK